MSLIATMIIYKSLTMVVILLRLGAQQGFSNQSVLLLILWITVIDNGFNVVNKYTTDGNLVKSWVAGGRNLSSLDTQNAITTDTLNNVYVSSDNHTFKFTGDGQLITSWGSKGSGNGQFNQIVGIATDSANNVYVTDKYNVRVEKFTADGNFIKSWGSISDCHGTRVFCSEPQGIATDPSNNVYVTEYNAGRVSKFTADGSLLTGWDVPSAYGIVVDRLGNVYISSGTNAILVYAPTSGNTPPPDTTPPSITIPHSITAEATSPSGAIVTYQVTATDNVDGPLTPACNPPSGSTFPIGDTTVICTATDKAGNTAKATFTVTVQDTTPPDTTITSAVDGSNRAITNSGSTLYSSIQTSFTGSDKVGIAGYQCSLDSQTASSCTSPVTFNNLAVGTHTFQVRAIDTSNNVDQTPSSFTWTIVTPSQYTQQIARNLVNGITNGGSTGSSIVQFIQGIQQLVQFIQHNSLPANTATSLAIPLNQAMIALTDGNPNNDAAACNTMNGFAAQVNSYLARGQISPTLAAQLIQQAQAIKTISRC